MKDIFKKDWTNFIVSLIIASALFGFPFRFDWQSFGMFILVLIGYLAGFITGNRSGYSSGYWKAKSETNA